MTGPEDSLLDAFSKEFPDIAMPDGLSPFLEDHSPIPPPQNPPPVQPMHAPAMPAAPQNLRRTPDNISHFSAPADMQIPDNLLPPAPPARRAPTAPKIEAGDSISSLSMPGIVGEDPYANHSSGISPRPAASPENDPLAKLNAILLTSTDHFQGRMVEAYLGPVDSLVVASGEAVFLDDTPQGKFCRFKGAQIRLKQLMQLGQLELRNDAMKMGANAILRYTYQQTSMGNAVIMTFTGTAVRLGS